MSTAPAPDPLTVYEQAWLAILDAEAQAVQSTLGRFGSVSWVSSAQLASYLGVLNRMRWHIGLYANMASDLAARGKPAFSLKLSELERRLDTNITTYNYALQSKLSFERAMAPSPWPYSQPPLAADPSFTQMIQDADARMRQAHERANRGWESISNRTCVHCGTPLGDSYYYVNICPNPNCGLYPRPT